MDASFGNATSVPNSVTGQLITKPYFEWNNARAKMSPRDKISSP